MQYYTKLVNYCDTTVVQQKNFMATSKKSVTKKEPAKRVPNPNETRIMMRFPNTKENNVYGMLEKLAKGESRSMNSMVVELIKRASKTS